MTETLPDKVLEEADEVVIVDIQPKSLQNRLKRGAIYADGHSAEALEHFFRLGNLNALRELALRKVADQVDVDLQRNIASSIILIASGIRQNGSW